MQIEEEDQILESKMLVEDTPIPKEKTRKPNIIRQFPFERCLMNQKQYFDQ
jgi:hypothetical protein